MSKPESWLKSFYIAKQVSWIRHTNHVRSKHTPTGTRIVFVKLD